MSERNARILIAQAKLFERWTKIETAYGRGDISSGKAFLVDRVADSKNLVAFLTRAGSVTHRQFQREVRVLEWIHRCGGKLARRYAGPFPHPGLDAALIDELCRWGWESRRVNELLVSNQRGPVMDGSCDPAVNPALLRRIEMLIDLLVLTIWDDPPDLDMELPPDARQTSGKPGALLRLRFWAPDPIAADWCDTIRAIRQRNGPLCAVWMAVSLLIDAIEREWVQEDPASHLSERRIIERDGYLCTVPGCSRMSQLEVHHIHFRSAGGSNEPSNKTTLCAVHHRHGIHEGRIRVSGSAPHAMVWEIGRRSGRAPLLYLRGERIVPDFTRQPPDL
jgi:hypothetical protein